MMAALTMAIRNSPLTLFLAGLSLLTFVLPASQVFLELKLSEVDGWSIASLLGCHLLHWNADHLFWDVLMFVALGLICESRFWHRYYVTLIAAAIAIPVVVAWTDPQITQYRGLSGLDTAVFSLLISHQLFDNAKRKCRSVWIFGVLWLLMCGKLLYEFASGQTLFVQDTSFVALPMAHLVGVVVGLLVSLLNYFGGDRLGDQIGPEMEGNCEAATSREHIPI